MPNQRIMEALAGLPCNELPFKNNYRFRIQPGSDTCTEARKKADIPDSPNITQTPLEDKVAVFCLNCPVLAQGLIAIKLKKLPTTLLAEQS